MLIFGLGLWWMLDAKFLLSLGAWTFALSLFVYDYAAYRKKHKSFRFEFLQQFDRKQLRSSPQNLI